MTMNNIKKLAQTLSPALFAAAAEGVRGTDPRAPRRGISPSKSYLSALLMSAGLITAASSAQAISWQYLGGSSGYNHTSGQPNGLTDKSSVMPTDLLTTVLNRLPEGQGIGNNPTALAQLTDDAGANLFLKATANVKISYVTEGAGYENSLAYFKFTTATLGTLAITSVVDTMLFPNFSNTVLDFGKAVDLGTFNAGDAIGFTLIANGWQTVVNGRGTHTGAVDPNKATGKIFRTIKRFNPETAGTNNLQAHTILFAYPEKELMVLAFEDLNRQSASNNDFGYGSDNDFNDVVIAIHVSPWSAVDCTNCNLLVPPTPITDCKQPLTTTPIPAAALTNNGRKVNICHFPPGNTSNVQKINISVNALNTHLSHHDDSFQINGVCYSTACPVTSCTAPQVLQNGACVTPPPTCTAPQVLQNGACVTPPPTCTAPQVLQNGVCVTPPPTCTAPLVLKNGVCGPLTCTAPQIPENGACVTPPPLSGESGPISWREITEPPAVVDNNKATKASVKVVKDAAKAQCIAEELINNTGRNCNNI
jgi:hypothetical protein